MKAEYGQRSVNCFFCNIFATMIRVWLAKSLVCNRSYGIYRLSFIYILTYLYEWASSSSLGPQSRPSYVRQRFECPVTSRIWKQYIASVSFRSVISKIGCHLWPKLRFGRVSLFDPIFGGEVATIAETCRRFEQLLNSLTLKTSAAADFKPNL